MAQEDGFGKWGATVTEIIPATIDKVWAVLADFDGIQRNFPQFFGSCETVEGEKNKPGSLRLATAAVRTPAGKIIDARERLLTLDDANHTISWLVESNGLGWTGFQAHISCESVENRHTLVKWTYEVNASSTKNITEEEYVKKQSGFYLEVLHTTKAETSSSRRGTNYEKEDRFGLTPLYSAKSKSFEGEEVFEYLLGEGAPYNETTVDTATIEAEIAAEMAKLEAEQEAVAEQAAAVDTAKTD